MHCESLRAARLGCKLAANNISTNLLTNGKHGLTLTPLIDTRTVGTEGTGGDPPVILAELEAKPVSSNRPWISKAIML